MNSNKRVDLHAILRDPKRRRDLMTAALVAMQAREGIATTQAEAEAAYEKIQAELAKSRSAVALGRKGGKARAAKLTPEQRKEIAQKAAQARWAKKEGQ